MKANSMASTPMEAECKFRVQDAAAVRKRLNELNAVFVRQEVHRDTYLRHPSRDFRATDEALRIREVDGEPFITYKGPRLAGPIKIRPEIELPLVHGTVEEWLKIWGHLGFVVALMVPKTREVYTLEHNRTMVTITLDHVEPIGFFAEIERIVHSADEIAKAQIDIQAVGHLLGLSEVEPRSYLGLLLSRTSLAEASTRTPG
jgi:adenylate cyclase, class 2